MCLCEHLKQKCKTFSQTQVEFNFNLFACVVESALIFGVLQMVLVYCKIAFIGPEKHSSRFLILGSNVNRFIVIYDYEVEKGIERI